MANALILSKTLRIGVDEALYVATAGAFNTTGPAGTGPANGCFAVPPQCSNYRGHIWFQFLPIGGSMTAFTFQLETSLDGGHTWGILTQMFPVTGAPVTLTTYSAIALGAFATNQVLSFDISGLGGNGCLR